MVLKKLINYKWRDQQMELPLVECNKKEFEPRWARDSRPKCGLRVLPSHLDGQTAWCPGVLSWAKIRYRCVEPKDPKKYWWSKPRDTAAITRHLHNHFQIKFRGTLVKVLGLPYKTSRKCLTPLSRTEISWFLNLLFGDPPPPPRVRTSYMEAPMATSETKPWIFLGGTVCFCNANRILEAPTKRCLLCKEQNRVNGLWGPIQ